jgi:hypothetical protein
MLLWPLFRSSLPRRMWQKTARHVVAVWNLKLHGAGRYSSGVQSPPRAPPWEVRLLHVTSATESASMDDRVCLVWWLAGGAVEEQHGGERAGLQKRQLTWPPRPWSGGCTRVAASRAGVRVLPTPDLWPHLPAGAGSAVPPSRN